MAINTSGFRVSNLARYTPVDPTLVGLNPNAFMSGMEGAMKIGSLREKILADRALQEELAATRESRIKRQQAENVFGASSAESQGRRLPVQEQYELAQLASNIKRLPAGEELFFSDTKAKKAENERLLKTVEARTAQELAAAKLAEERAKGELGILPGEFDAKSAVNRLATGRAGSELSMLGAESAAKLAKLNRSKLSDLRAVSGGLDEQMELLNLGNLVSNYKKGKIGAELAGELTLSEIAKNAATADQARANAEFIDKGGKDKRSNDVQELTALQRSLLQVDNEMVADPVKPDVRIPLSIYEAKYGTPEKPKIERNWLSPNAPYPRNPAADALLENRNNIQKRIAALNKRLSFDEGSSSSQAKDIGEAITKLEGKRPLTADDLANKYLKK